ncbi:MAG: hypothetical protein LBD96_02465 [Treponema sp.]|jgi:hypothetical protein|nr:hypothetical protein [Treponema sp.]
MKNFFKVFGIAALVAAIGFLTAACDLDAAYEKLNGVWDYGTFAVRFDNSNGVFSRIGSDSGWYEVQNHGNVKIGDRKFKDIVWHKSSKAGERWTCQELVWYTWNYTTHWVDCTITMSDDGNTIYTTSSAGTMTYKRQE